MESDHTDIETFIREHIVLPEGHYNTDIIDINADLDWSDLMNDLDQEHTIDQTGMEPKEALNNNTAGSTTAEADAMVKEEHEDNAQHSPRQSHSSEVEDDMGYDQHAHEPAGGNFKSSPTYTHADVDSSPLLFSAGIDNMLHGGMNNQMNLDYYPLQLSQSNVMRDLNARKAARSRAATVSTTRDFLERHSASRNPHPNPLPTLESLRYKYGERAPPPSEALPDDVPFIDDLLNPHLSGVDMETIFSSAEEASSYYSQEFHLPPDDSVPTTIEQKKAIVKALCTAIMSVEKAEDNPGMIRPFAECKYSPRRVELACWHLLEACITRHVSGPLLAAYDVKYKQSSDIPTFAERMDRIFKCLVTQKTICKHLLDPFYLYTFVDDPIGAHKRVIANKTLNRRKGEVMNAGKQVLGHGRVNPAAGTITPGSRDPEDPFTAGSPFSTPQHGMSTTATMSPDSVNRRGIASMMLSSPASSSPGSEKYNLPGLQRGVITGTSSFNATPNLAHINRSLHSSPIMRSMHTVSPGLTSLSHNNSGQASRRQSFRESEASQLRAQFAAQFQAAHLAGIDPALRPQARRMTAPTSHPRTDAENTLEATGTRRFKGNTGASAGRRKRKDSDSDSEYLPSPAKKAQR
ncbi:hypothetical protein DTO164E3_6929 [Paecilomyces variotii]|nr:hypothetical protein DTO164E3_6929 [Paecilomyces variotii]KAJ9204388.1 hypothetical protein DTO032I3_2643 [Paecilomyces variotii]KAJ9279058.1 hypothetical protein DTO021D3_4095 [Paecilomyces variotii]KAJ9344356.1 hypothetical protein DTO027B6_2974 [Paecilomyces variotii]KAJ9388213.1 hypothetical protein DTO032I4_2837 [Paecilomyces variotii]